LPDFYRALLIGTAGATALALLVGIALATSLTRPIRELTHATQAMARGELEQEIPVRSQDELGQLAASFNQMSAELARGERVRKQMTADIAHELRTPLSLILGHAEAIRDGVLPATPETLDIVYDEARRLTHLVEDLNTLSLSDAGRLPLHREPVSPAGLLQRAAAAHRPRALARDIALDVDAQDDLPRISADPVRMAQVLDNLLSNAMRYTPRGGRIHLAARQVDGELRLVIQDSGPGIPPEDLARIFDRFYRADKSRQRNEGGSGLGLAIARSIVEGHGGRLWAENAPTGGARFVIALPVTQSLREA
jgi:signal transduction histidine kinase